MDIRIREDKITTYECDILTKKELEFIMFLMNKGGYWELRDNGESYTLHDEGNFKYKGSLEQIRRELAPPMEHIVVPYTEFRNTIQCEMGFTPFAHGSPDEQSKVRHLESCEGFYNGKAVVVDYTK